MLFNYSKVCVLSQVDLKQVRLAYVEEPGDGRVSAVTQETKDVMNQAILHLEEVCGSQAEKVQTSLFPFLQESKCLYIMASTVIISYSPVSYTPLGFVWDEFNTT